MKTTLHKLFTSIVTVLWDHEATTIETDSLITIIKFTLVRAPRTRIHTHTHARKHTYLATTTNSL